MLEGTLNQTATYWGTPVKDGFGKLTFASPTPVQLRWQDKQELFMNSEGKEELSQAVIYLEQDVEIDAYLYLGTSLIVNPATVSGANPIKAFSKTVDLNGIIIIRKVWL